jgi:hypothetical protein
MPGRERAGNVSLPQLLGKPLAHSQQFLKNGRTSGGASAAKNAVRNSTISFPACPAACFRALRMLNVGRP